MIIITADDFGRDIRTTDNILNCALHNRITSASMMVFMADSDRAATLAKGSSTEIGLHFNFTEPFTSHLAAKEIRFHQDRIRKYLRSTSIARIFYNPLLDKSFKLVAAAQMEEYHRLFGDIPSFINGHHHQHLCSNMIIGKFLPTGIPIRTTFSFEYGEKNLFNIWYRYFLKMWVRKNYRSTKSFFSITPLHDDNRINGFFKRAHTEDIEIEVHPGNEEELRFLISEKFRSLMHNAPCGGFRMLQAAK